MINHERRRGAVVVALTGDLDHRRADQIRPELDELLKDPKIKELARFETASNQEHGVLKGIRWLMEQNLC